jgi:hypothetical protein
MSERWTCIAFIYIKSFIEKEKWGRGKIRRRRRRRRSKDYIHRGGVTQVILTLINALRNKQNGETNNGIDCIMLSSKNY